MAKAYKAKICKVSPRRDRAMLPLGAYCNRGLDALRRGDTLTLNEGWRRHKVTVEGTCRVPVASPYFTFELRSMFGERFSWGDLQDEWDALCVIEGLGREAYDRRSVMLVEYREYY